MMSSSVIMNIKSDAFRYGVARSQPFIIWLQFMNFAMVSVICWLFLKLYRGALSLYEWMFPLKCNTFDKPLIMVIGSGSDLNEEIVKRLSTVFQARIIRLKDANENDTLISSSGAELESRIIYTQMSTTSREVVTRFSEFVRRVFGEVDILLISEGEELPQAETNTHAFLNNLNRQLLVQFWIVMAFLPGMLKRNSGHIMSMALGRTSCLTNTGIVRTVCEELLSSDTKVRFQMFHSNSIIQDYFPALPSDIMAGLIVREMWRPTTYIRTPYISQYIVMLPLIIARYIFHSVLKVLSILSVNSPK